jgi:hypothetical protein
MKIEARSSQPQATEGLLNPIRPVYSSRGPHKSGPFLVIFPPTMSPHCWASTIQRCQKGDRY